jgi:hypothetical protein
MDLQALLNTTDSSSEDETDLQHRPRQPPQQHSRVHVTSSAGGGGAVVLSSSSSSNGEFSSADTDGNEEEDAPLRNIDLEQILREDDSDDEYSLEHVQRPNASHHKITTPLSTKTITLNNFASSSNHNPEDWAVLQQILNEDDDDEDESEDEDQWMKAMEQARSSKNRHNNVDELLFQSEEDYEDNNQSSREVSSSVNAVFQRSIFTDTKMNNQQNMDNRDYKQELLKEEKKISELTSVIEASSPAIPGTKQPLDSFFDVKDRTAEEEQRTKRNLAQAEMLERKLLKAGHREIVSPLMVKRRLKPKLELVPRKDHNQMLQSSPRNSTRAADQTTPSTKQKQQQLQRRMLNVPRFGFSGIVDHKSMNGVSASIVKHADPNQTKILCGLPTCLAFNTKFIAIGTQEGIILIFDLFQTLRQRLGASASYDDGHHGNIRNAGAITSLDLSYHGEAVVAGYTNGILVLWDTIRGIILRTVVDAHPSPITAVRFLTELKMVTVDAGGLVNKLTFTKNMLWSNYSLETECLLDGTAGQILAMNVLAPFSTVKPMMRPESFASGLRNLTLIALSSERSSFAVAVDPKVNVLHRWARPPEDRTKMIVVNSSVNLPLEQVYLPCLAWGWALLSGGGNVVMPVLARAWGCCLQLLVSSFPTLDDGAPARVVGEEPPIHWPAFGVSREVDTTTPVVAVEWLNERSLVFLTATYEFTLIDTVMMTLLERLDFSVLKLVYAEFSLSRSVSKESGNDSNVAATCNTFQNSIRCSDDRLLVLCQDDLRCVSIVGARQRISALEADGEWLEALAFALDHYENTVISQEDRRRDPLAKRDLSRHPEFSIAKSDDEEWIAKLLIRYLNLAVENAPESSGDARSPYSQTLATRIDLAHSHFQMLAGVCVEFCVVTRRLDLLFGPIFRRFQSVGFIAVFLDVLEPYVLNDKLSYIAPEVMSYFVEHCKATNGIATVERCLLHMDCTIMDFDSILILLRSNEMYSALFYVFNQGLNDYVSPLEILLEKLFNEADAGGIQRSDDSLRNHFERLGYKAILYLQSCFRGKTFPQEKPLEPEDRVDSLRVELLHFLMRESYSPSSHVKRSVNLLPEVGQRSFPYPYMRILLLVDSRGVLDTLSLALEPNSDSIIRTRSASGSVEEWVDGRSQNGSFILRQELADQLSAIFLPKQADAQISSFFPSKSDVNAFLDFAATYVLNGAIRLHKSAILMLFARMSAQFASAKDGGERQLHQRKIMDLLSALSADSYEPDQVLELFKKSNMHRAALLLHQQVASSWHESDYDDITLRIQHFLSAIDCYIGDDDKLFRINVFDYVKKECSACVPQSNIVDSSEPTSIRDSMFTKLSALVHLEPLLTARLVAELFVDDLDRAIHSLEAAKDDKGLFLFLQAIISGQLIEVDPVAGSVLNLTMEHHHKYLALMAKLHPEMVYDYLSTHDSYRAEECLRLCQEHEIADASAYLLERMGNVTSALQLILQTLETRLMGLKRTIRGLGVDLIRHHSGLRFPQKSTKINLPSKQAKEVDGVRRILVVALDVCERNSETFGQPDSGSSKFAHGELWFSVLDRLINAKGFLRLSKEQPEHARIMEGVLSDLLRLTMQRMVSNVPLTDLVRKVTSDHSGSQIGELREMIESLLATYDFELKVFKSAVTVFNHEILSLRKEQVGLQIQGAPVSKFMNETLESDEKSAGHTRMPMDSSVSDDCALLISRHGNASVVENERISQSAKAAHGLVGAVRRLRLRRGFVVNSPCSQSNNVSMMTLGERTYQDAEPVVYGERLVGVLGEAEHRGRLMSFN